MGPAWIGIGAQRSGTTWLTDLILQHPALSLNSTGRKELHFFEDFATETFTPDHVAEYQGMFTGMGGEWTPAYLRCLWVPELIQVASPDSLLLVSLRDPIERYRSSLRWYSRHQKGERTTAWYRHGGVEAIWGGMYATQLEAWRRVVGERIMVVQYEAIVTNPVAAVEAVWQRLGLSPVPLSATSERSWTSTEDDDRPPPADLRELYRPEVHRLEQDWDIDPTLWPSTMTG